jgi:hypothetical protein
MLTRSPSAPAASHVADDWSFEIRNRSIVIRASGNGWMVKSVTLNGDDVTDAREFAPGQTSAGLQIMLTKIDR